MNCFDHSVCISLIIYRKRVDHYQRAELCLGTYECAATKDYCREGLEPQTPGILFAIDVSYPMMKEGIVQMICSNMKEMLKNLPRDMYCDNVSFFVFLYSSN